MDKSAQQVINSIRVLSADMIEKANSGHPGTPIGAAPIAYTLFTEHLKHNPKNPAFFNRDRFVLSAGHASAMLYSLLHVCGYQITKEDLTSFRQLKSKTPGHPELGVTPGVEVSTGPLGQGIANAVGLALAERVLASEFNKPNNELIDHYTYAFCGDGCMMEGIEYEAASIAGTWKLGKLIVIYDKNDISIEGNISLAFSDDVAKRHEAQGWQVINVEDGEDIEAVSAAITLAKSDKNRPSLIIVKTIIGRGTSKANDASCHGAPLGGAAIEDMKNALGWKNKPFETPKDVALYTAEICEKGAKAENDWKKLLSAYKSEYPDDYEELNAWIKSKFDLYSIPEIWGKIDAKDTSTRNLSGIILNKLTKHIPNLIGGSADLGPSNKSIMSDVEYFSPATPAGRNIHYGVREMAMAAISNGLAVHGGFQPYCATFFVFSDYMKGAMRMSAIMNLPVLYLLSHDSIAVGEDGATHEPVEHLTALRATPDIEVWRAANATEISAGYASNITGRNTVALITSRQSIDIKKEPSMEDAQKGGYIISESSSQPALILMGSGSEVSLLIGAQAQLEERGISTRVVSMPCMEAFEKQKQAYRDSVLTPSVRARVAVEAGSALSWGRYVGLDGACICMDNFGDSAPAQVLFEINHFTVADVVALAVKTYKKAQR